MRVLMVHNYYRRRGGEDESVDDDVRMLRDAGWAVRTYTRSSLDLSEMSRAQAFVAGLGAVWSPRAYRDALQAIDAFRPDVVHVQNFFPLISPSVFYACARRGVASVLTLHNYRLLCPIAVFLREGKVCEECVQHSLWRGVGYACYHDSRLQTAVVAAMLRTHRLLRTWSRKVDMFTTLSQFARDKLVEGGVPGDRMEVRPSFLVNDPGVGGPGRSGAAYIGRLSVEKGVGWLLDSWREIRDTPLAVVGDGPLRKELEGFAATHGLDKVRFLGRLPHVQALEIVKQCAFTVAPSRCYETFGRTVVESYATGTPVVATDHGSMAELVQHGRTGLLVSPEDRAGLADALRLLLSDPERTASMGRTARGVYENAYTAKQALPRLQDIYARAAGTQGT